MRCPVCRDGDDKVVDSRAADDGAAIRRRRECLTCGHRFTTFERVEESTLSVRKRDGAVQPFDRDKLVAGLTSAAKNRPLSDLAIAEIVNDIEERLRLEGPEVSSELIGLAALERLRATDEVAYMRFASVYKGFDGVEDFQSEVRMLRKKSGV